MEGLYRVQRTESGDATATPVATNETTAKNMRRRLRRQLAEALLGRAAVVVEEESTRVWLLQASASMHGQRVNDELCESFDLAGISVVSADGNGEVAELCDTLVRAGVTAFGFVDSTRGQMPLDSKRFPGARLVFHSAQGLEDLLVAALPREVVSEAMTEAPFVKEHSDASVLKALDDRAFQAKAREFLRHNKGSIPFHEWLAERTPVAHMPRALRDVVVLAQRVAGGREQLTHPKRAL